MTETYNALGMQIKIWHGDVKHDFLLTLSGVFSVRLMSKTAQTMTFTDIVDCNIGNAYTNYCPHLPEPSFFFDRNAKQLVCFSAGTYTYFEELENRPIHTTSLQKIYALELLESKKTTDSWEMCFFDKNNGIIMVLDATIKKRAQINKKRIHVKELFLMDSFSFLCEGNQLVGYTINLKQHYGKQWNQQEADFLYNYLDISITPDWDDEAQEKMACDSLHKLLDRYQGTIFYQDVPELKDWLTFFDDDFDDGLDND